MTSLAGARCLVTGASRGIGAATARLLTERGASVALVARASDDLLRLQAALPGSTSHAVDVTDGVAVAAAAAEIGAVDVLVNNAGRGAYGPALSCPPETVHDLMDVNFWGTVHVTRAVAPGMVDRGRGHIVNVASIAGRLGAPFEAAYSASKFAVVGWTEALAVELAPAGVQVSLVNPGPVRTHFTEVRGVDFQRRFPRPLSAESVARTIVDVIEGDRPEAVRPRWLAVGTWARALSPSAYRRGVVRSFRGQRASR